MRCKLKGDIVVDKENQDIAIEKIRDIGKEKYEVYDGFKSTEKIDKKCAVLGKHFHNDKTHLKTFCFVEASKKPKEEMKNIVNKITGIAKRY